ncbi:LysR family transcriptional regulator [Tritonibacter mobilis]|uniref:LysR family transcriptional regulator n=1 Tax=Tritonibacter mobilis TaxID=379347 RepID=UPI000806ACB9|nr:LysR family transcriptional regulator [Tritonibacter mobilis]GLP88907.1 LysR family transcriptional regulator [Tritonibacter mobilis]SDX68992.1 DNA-binding transcriptional regulator, LysR family [Tritonibacter mobilis]
MDIQQLRVFVTVAKYGSITRASDILCRSQPSVSAQIKGLETTLGIALFERTSRGMIVTQEGERLLDEAISLVDRHKQFMQEASRLKGSVSGVFMLGAGRHSGNGFVSAFLHLVSERFPELEIELKHLGSAQVIEGLRDNSLDMGFFTETESDTSDLTLVEVASFGIYLAAPPGIIRTSDPLDWQQLADQIWIVSSHDGCCGRWANALMEQHDICPKRIIKVDDEAVTRTLVASGAGIGLVHVNADDTLPPPKDIDLLHRVRKTARIMCGYLEARSDDPSIRAVDELVLDLLKSDASGATPSMLQLA